MSHPIFMSPEHVATMNKLLAASDEVRREAAALDRSYLVAYRLSNGPGGEEWWTLSFSPEGGVVFGLGQPSQNTDLVLRCDWAAAVRAARAEREGRTIETDIAMEGDADLMNRISTIFATARQVATVPVRFPNV